MPLGTSSLACHSPLFLLRDQDNLTKTTPATDFRTVFSGWIYFVSKGILRSLFQVFSPGLFSVLSFHSVFLVLENKTLLFPQINSADVPFHLKRMSLQTHTLASFS